MKELTSPPPDQSSIRPSAAAIASAVRAEGCRVPCRTSLSIRWLTPESAESAGRDTDWS